MQYTKQALSEDRAALTGGTAPKGYLQGKASFSAAFSLNTEPISKIVVRISQSDPK